MQKQTREDLTVLRCAQSVTPWIWQYKTISSVDLRPHSVPSLFFSSKCHSTGAARCSHTDHSSLISMISCSCAMDLNMCTDRGDENTLDYILCTHWCAVLFSVASSVRMGGDASARQWWPEGGGNATERGRNLSDTGFKNSSRKPFLSDTNSSTVLSLSQRSRLCFFAEFSDGHSRNTPPLEKTCQTWVHQTRLDRSLVVCADFTEAIEDWLHFSLKFRTGRSSRNVIYCRYWSVSLGSENLPESKSGWINSDVDFTGLICLLTG